MTLIPRLCSINIYREQSRYGILLVFENLEVNLKQRSQESEIYVVTQRVGKSARKYRGE